MTRKFGKSIIVSTGLAVLAVSAATLAVASIPSNLDDTAARAELHGTEAGIPVAATGMSLFDGGPGPVCYSKDQVISYFDQDRTHIGGEMVTLEVGFDQDFADTWRSETKMQAVSVSGVFAHIFPSDAGFNMVDVVEIGGDGCAISRTLLTEQEWNSILVRAAGVSV